MVAATGFASAAMAAPEPRTRLVSCGEEDCLLIAGHRVSPDAPIAINGHVVTVEGKRSWQVRLPITTVRAWSAPFARSIAVTTGEQVNEAEEASLPIGLLGHRTDLAALVVRVR